MSVDETLMCSFQILKPSEKKTKYQYGGMNTGRPVTPPRAAALAGTGSGSTGNGLTSTSGGSNINQNTQNINNNLKGKK